VCNVLFSPALVVYVTTVRCTALFHRDSVRSNVVKCI